MSKKKILYISLLVIVVIAIGGFAVFTATRTERLDVNKSNTNASLGNKTVDDTNVTEPVNDESKSATKVEKLDDGTLYSLSDEDMNAEIVIGDNYFDTQMADISLNFAKYDGKTVEIEGMALTNGPYTFVGRYSTSNICPNCPAGYSYFEYEWNGDKKPLLIEEKSWIKVKGTFKKGDDNGMEYYYIDVASMELMNERGIDTVSN